MYYISIIKKARGRFLKESMDTKKVGKAIAILKGGGRRRSSEGIIARDYNEHTLIKKIIKFSLNMGNSAWSSCKVIYEEGLPNI